MTWRRITSSASICWAAFACRSAASRRGSRGRRRIECTGGRRQIVERRQPRTRRDGVDALDWKDALGVGLFQCLALWPGMSRSSSTILGGMMLGLERKTATEYSFFAAVPLVSAASIYKLYESRSLLSASNTAVFAIGFVASFVVAWASVKFLIRFLSRHTLVVFGWYRLVVGAAVLGWALG